MFQSYILLPDKSRPTYNVGCLTGLSYSARQAGARPEGGGVRLWAGGLAAAAAGTMVEIVVVELVVRDFFSTTWDDAWSPFVSGKSGVARVSAS